jgi:integrase
MGRKKYDGTVSLRTDGRWMGKLWLDDGTRKSVYGKSRAEVEGKLRRLAADQAKGLPIVSDKRTVAEFLTEWLETVRPRLQPTTYARYEGLMRVQVIPELGTVKLSRLTPQQVQKLYTTWSERGLSPTSVKHMHTVLRGALAQAVKWEYLGRNPADLVVKPKAAPREMHPLNQEQVGRLLDAAAGDRLEALYVLAVSVGMREGELLALRWENIDFQRGVVQVRGTMQPTKDGLRIAPPKTKAAKRNIQLPTLALDALKAHRTAQNTERLRLGTWGDLDLVFPNRFGQPMGAAVLLKGSFHPLLKRAGLPHMRFHELRHTASTLQLESGTSLKMVSNMLGHGGISVTADLYLHVTTAMQEEAARAGDEILSRRAQARQ